MVQNPCSSEYPVLIFNFSEHLPSQVVVFLRDQTNRYFTDVRVVAQDVAMAMTIWKSVKSSSWRAKRASRAGLAQLPQMIT